MILPILTSLIFLVTLGLLISASYFFVLAPLQKQKLKTRLAAVQEMTVRSEHTPEEEILRREMLSDIPLLNRILVELPLVARIQLLLEQAAIDMQVAAFLLIVFSAMLAAMLVALVVDLTFVSAALVSIMAGAVPFLVALYKRRQRFSKFEEQF